MKIRYFGHSLFTLTLENGKTILTDPYGSFCRYPLRELEADVVTISHHHYDHDALEIVRGKPLVLDEADYYLPADDLIITGISTFHDNHTGLRRGTNIVFTIQTEGLKIAHLGDLGHLPDDAQREAIGEVDVLMIPVGGTYTLDANRAYQCVQLLKPRVTIPMHYKTRFSEDMGIATASDFIKLMGVCAEPVMVCEVSRETLPTLPKLVLMDIQK